MTASITKRKHMRRSSRPIRCQRALFQRYHIGGCIAVATSPRTSSKRWVQATTSGHRRSPRSSRRPTVRAAAAGVRRRWQRAVQRHTTAPDRRPHAGRWDYRDPGATLSTEQTDASVDARAQGYARRLPLPPRKAASTPHYLAGHGFKNAPLADRRSTAWSIEWTLRASYESVSRPALTIGATLRPLRAVVSQPRDASAREKHNERS